jgi:hypothetical protein
MRMMNKRLITASVAGAAAALTLAGVTTAHALAGSAAQPATMGGMAPVNAQMVTASFGWVMTPDSMLITRNGGRTFVSAKVPLPSSYARDALFVNAEDGLAAAATGNTLTIARTTNGGVSWDSTTAAEPALNPAIGYQNLSIAARGGTEAILAQVATGMNFSVGTLFASHNAGVSWDARPAPAAGNVSVDARGGIWVAGGVLGNQLYSSADRGASWARSTVTLQRGQQLAAVAAPTGSTTTATALLKDGTTQVDTLVTADNGRTWHATSSVSIHGKATAGVLVPVTSTARGSLVLDTAGSASYLASGSHGWLGMRAAGLPEGVVTASFAPGGTHGWALATYGKCLRFKADCTLYRELVETTDAGASWHQLALWADRIN